MPSISAKVIKLIKVNNKITNNVVLRGINIEF